MNNRRALACVVILLQCVVVAPRAGGADGSGNVKLIVHITDLRNRDGQLIFGVFDRDKGFPSDSKHAINWQVRKGDEDKGSVTFVAELLPGRYAASILHDENSNNKMDQNLIGVPKEGYGVTNNPKPRFRGAKFDEALFDLTANGAELTISLQYF